MAKIERAVSVEAAQHARHVQHRLAHEPVVAARLELGVGTEHALRDRRACLQEHQADVLVVEAQAQQRVVELAEGAQRPPVLPAATIASVPATSCPGRAG